MTSNLPTPPVCLMGRRQCLCLLIFTLSAAHMPAWSKTWQAARLPQAQESQLHSQLTGQDYRIQIATIGKIPENGYPSLFLLDGDQYFPYALSLAHTLLFNPETQEHQPLLLIGIGYGSEKLLHLDKRQQDYTPPPRDKTTAAEHSGGAEAFAQFIQTELKPFINQQHKINPHAQYLFGHSYGGLFATYQLYTQPQTFQYYYLSSPSLWWDNKRIQDYAANFQAEKNSLHIHISVGELEQSKADDQRRQARAMLGNAQALAQSLEEKQHSQFNLLPQETHGSAGFAALKNLLLTMRENALSPK